MQSNLCFFVVLATVLVVCVSAGEDKPDCLKPFTDEQKAEHGKLSEECKKEVEGDDDKAKKMKIMGCIMVKKGLMDKDGIMNEQAVMEGIEKTIVTDYQEPIKKLSKECMESSEKKAQTYFPCTMKKMKEDKVGCEYKFGKKKQ